METGPIRVAIMADTHGVLRPEVERILETCDVIVHAGDFDNQMLYHKLNVDQPLYAVRGNNDRGWSGGLGQVNRFEIGGVKFIMAHERVDIPSVLKDIQVVIFGHSHMYYQQEISGRLWLNPGSCGYKRFTLPLSMAVMTIVETVWLEHGYGTPGAATSQREKAKASKYEKQQKRYKQKQAKGEGQADKAKGAVKAARYGGQPAARQEAVKPAPDQENGLSGTWGRISGWHQPYTIYAKKGRTQMPGRFWNCYWNKSLFSGNAFRWMEHNGTHTSRRRTRHGTHRHSKSG